ncbi:MAG: hypothetical protein MRZ79_12145 [Bacteroidia bacterium]|nr:hypothetical protein [Bacteroidia bacterium]
MNPWLLIVGAFLMILIANQVNATHAFPEASLPKDTIDHWYVFLGDSLLFNSSIITTSVGILKEIQLNNWNKSERDLIIIWGGCTPTASRLATVVNPKGKPKASFSGPGEIVIPRQYLRKLKRGNYLIYWNNWDGTIKRPLARLVIS